MVADIMLQGRNAIVKSNGFCVFIERDEYANVSLLSPRKGKSAPVRFKGNMNDLIDLFEEVARELRFIEKENGVD